MTKEIKLPEGLSADQAADVLRDYAMTDDAQIVDQETLSALQAEIDEAKEAFAAVIAEQSPQSAETLARQDMDALTEPFRTDEGEIDVDTLRQEPTTQDTVTDGTSADDTPSWDFDSLGLEQERKLQQLKHKRTSFANRGIDDRVDALEQEMVDLAGAPDWETLSEDL